MVGTEHYSGSPFLDLIDTRLEAWRDGFARISIEIRPNLLNRSGVIHGGVLATLLDHAAGLSGLHCSVPGNRRFGMTLSLTTHYLGQAKAGRLVATGVRSSGGSKIYFADSEIRSEGNDLLAKGSAVYRYRSGSENPEGTPDQPWAKTTRAE